jgi:hypothetical protein
MDDFLEGQKNKEAYTIFVIVCALYDKEDSSWDRDIIKAATNTDYIDSSLCTISKDTFCAAPVGRQLPMMALSFFQ